MRTLLLSAATAATLICSTAPATPAEKLGCGIITEQKYKVKFAAEPKISVTAISVFNYFQGTVCKTFVAEKGYAVIPQTNCYWGNTGHLLVPMAPVIYNRTSGAGAPLLFSDDAIAEDFKANRKECFMGPQKDARLLTRHKKWLLASTAIPNPRSTP